MSRLGQQALDKGLGVARATERLAVNLHPRLEQTVRRQWHLGEYELATFAAMKEVEIAVREASGLSESLIGVKLMRSAFGNSGPLFDPEMDPGEADALREMFSGSIGLLLPLVITTRWRDSYEL